MNSHSTDGSLNHDLLHDRRRRATNLPDNSRLIDNSPKPAATGSSLNTVIPDSAKPQLDLQCVGT